MASVFDLAITAWGVLGGGALTGKHAAPTEEPRRIASPSEAARDAATVMKEVAEGQGCSPAQLAVAWARRQHPALIPVLGARSERQIEDLLGVLDVDLDPASLERLAVVAGYHHGFPRGFLTRRGGSSRRNPERMTRQRAP